jgi:hypothetical protein
MGPATYRATTQEEGLRREAYSQVDEHLMASPRWWNWPWEPSQGADIGIQDPPK